MYAKTCVNLILVCKPTNQAGLQMLQVSEGCTLDSVENPSIVQFCKSNSTKDNLFSGWEVALSDVA